MCREGSDNAENLGVVRAALEAVSRGGGVEGVYRKLCFSLSGCRVTFPAAQKPLKREMVARMLVEGLSVGQVVEKVGCSRRYVNKIGQRVAAA